MIGEGEQKYRGVLLLLALALTLLPFLCLLALLAFLGFALLAGLGCPLCLHHVLHAQDATS